MTDRTPGKPTAATSPFSAEWRSTVLRDLASRAANGDDLDQLRAELLELLWPWAQRLADQEARRLPAGSDRDDTRSHVLTAVWQATRQIDWQRWETWPALLLRRVRGARIDAARSDDTVSRRDRVVLKRIDAEVAAAERDRGRTLTCAERDAVRSEVLAGLTPRRRSALASAVTGPPVLVDSFPGVLADDRWDPEQRAVASDRAVNLHGWLSHDVPKELSKQVYTWLEQDTRDAVVPARLRTKLLPYLPQLLDRVEDHEVPTVATSVSR